MQKGLTKVFGILFLVILVGLLVTHLVLIRNARAEFTEKETALHGQISDLNQKMEDMAMENRVLNVKLGIAGIRDDVISNNFGTARESVDLFQVMLVDGGCKKMDQLHPVFGNLKTSLVKKNDAAALASLEQIYNIIFEKQPAVAETNTE